MKERNLEIALCELLPHNAKLTYSFVNSHEEEIEHNEKLEPSLLSYLSEGCNSHYEVKPHLRSFDQLTKPIIVESYNEGKGFVPMDELSKWLYDEELESFNDVSGAKKWLEAMLSLESNEVLNLPYKIVNRLKQWHFNIWNLEANQYIEIV